MKTTLEIDEGVMRALKARAAREGRTMSELVETALRTLLAERPKKVELPPLPVFDLGGWLGEVVNDRRRLYDILEAERDERLYGWRPEKERGR